MGTCDLSNWRCPHLGHKMSHEAFLLSQLWLSLCKRTKGASFHLWCPITWKIKLGFKPGKRTGRTCRASPCGERWSRVSVMMSLLLGEETSNGWTIVRIRRKRYPTGGQNKNCFIQIKQMYTSNWTYSCATNLSPLPHPKYFFASRVAQQCLGCLRWKVLSCKIEMDDWAERPLRFLFEQLYGYYFNSIMHTYFHSFIQSCIL